VWSVPEENKRFSPGCPLGVHAPVEHCQFTAKCRCSASPRRPRTRVCLRKGCGRRYQARRWNQRYCQDPECLRQLRRWQAAQRQARRRQDDAFKAEHAAAERARRERARRERARVSAQAMPKPEVAAARGHAAKIFCPAVVRAAGVLRSGAKVGPQPGTLLWPRVQAGGPPSAGARTQVGLARHVPRPPPTPPGISSRPRAAFTPASRYRRQAATGTATAVTGPTTDRSSIDGPSRKTP